MNTKSFYKKNEKEMILRDFLAADRTILANERTFLSYIRTSLNFIVAGISFIKVFEYKMLEIVGSIFIVSGVCILGMGIYRYMKINKDLEILKNKE